MRRASLLAVLLVLASRTAASQTITVGGNPSALTVTTAVAGSEPNPVSSSTQYTITTPNAANRTYKVTAQLNANMPTGVTLTATMTNPGGGAVNNSNVTLSTTAADMVTTIPRNVNFTGTISYTLTATVSAGVVSSTSRTVTLTILQFP
ncbi:MAG TPA: hypothetical protein VJ867_03035 [Gemmatimonadaceae bacterium]|nr:hypothetical protein [Gemmatimonadaceae bacterium]